MRTFPYFFLAFPLFLAVSSSVARAERFKPPLEPGMSVGDVLIRWGDPEDKVEHESRRTVVWDYPDGKVIFLEGRLVAFPSRTQALDEKLAVRLAKRPAVPQPPSDGAQAANQKGDDILSEVLRELPPDDGKPAAPRFGGVQAPPGQPVVVKPLPGYPMQPPTVDAPDDSP